MKHPTDLERIASSRVTKLEAKEGQTIQLGNIRFTWKARGEDTGYQISMYEMVLAPNTGIPLHAHPYPEVFYVLEGKVNFSRLSSQGLQEWVSCQAGECVTASPNAAHTFFNHTDRPAKFLSVSTYQHEVLFNESATNIDINDPIPDQPDPEDFVRFGKVALKNHGLTIEP